MWKVRCPFRLAGSSQCLALLPEHVEVNIRSAEILSVGLAHTGVAFSALISTVNPKTLYHPFRSGLIYPKLAASIPSHREFLPFQGCTAMERTKP